MAIFLEVFLAALASLGVILAVLEFVRVSRAKKASFICLCFSEELLNGAKPDMLVICRTDAEQEEVIRRVCADESRKVYIKRW
ncbi:MAG: hypothetical protein IIW39_03940 [Clostridia bacterium]|jgi:hypothetical protein|nr:hypothetical protein [Clostridia bacterium]MBQ5837803.1 hypothetical protein [Clostridia bacterium]